MPKNTHAFDNFMSKTQIEIAEHLLRIKAVKIQPNDPFTWSSGLRSPIYCDNRLLLSYPQVRELVKNAFVEAANHFDDVDVIGGVATAGIPHGALMADAMSKPFIYVRAKAKGHGRQNKIEGHLEKGQRVLLIEDLISTGGSSLKAVDALVEHGVDVVGVLAIFSYGFDIADQAFHNASIPFRTLTSLDHLIDAAEKGGLSKSDTDLVRSWRKDPKAWGKAIS